MGYGWISSEEIRSRSTSNSYRKGSTYYEGGAVSSAARGKVIPYAGADKERDCISVMIKEQESAPRRKGSGKDGSYLVQVYAMGVTLCDCQAESRYVCRHTVAAMIHIMDNLEKIEAESPEGMKPIRMTRGDECRRHYDVAPALFFERKLIERRGDMKKAVADFKIAASHLGMYVEYSRYERMLAKGDAQYRAHDVAKDKAQFTAYMSYLHELMIKHADTPQKRIKYVRHLARNFGQAHNKFTAKVYEDAIAELACCGAEWRTYIANAAKTGGTRLSFYGTEARTDRWSSLLERIGK